MARLLDEYPEVFDAFWVRAVGLLSMGGGKRRSFAERRESSRSERIRKAVGRR